MAQVINLSVSGLQTNEQYLAAVPDGALLESDNFNNDRPGIIEKRRGFFLYGDPAGNDSSFRVKQLLSYKGVVLRHYNDVLEYDDGTGVFTAWSGSFIEPDGAVLRMKSIEVNGNYYFTTTEGIKKISANSTSQFGSVTVVPAGGLKALDVSPQADYTRAGFLPPLSKVAYRIVWAYKDNNNNLILGTPSPFTVATNASTTDSCVVQLTFPVPQGATSAHFYQVYRSPIIEATSLEDLMDITPEDELNLVIEDFPPSLTGEITVTDITPDTFRAGGTLLYTNPTSGEGILQANEPPPLANDLTLYRGFTIYANTKTKHTSNLNLLSVSGFVAGSTKLIISNGTTTDEFTFVGEESISDIEFATANYTSITDIDGKYFFLTSPEDERTYFVYFDSTGSIPVPTDADTIGKIPLKIDTSGDSTNEDIVDSIIFALSTSLEFTGSKTGSGSDVTLTITNDYNGYTTPYHISNSIDNPVPNPTGGTITFVDQVQAGIGEDAAAKEILLSSRPTPGQQVEETAQSIVSVINAQSTGIVYAYYLSSVGDVPGQMTLESRTIDDVPFYVALGASVIDILAITVGNPTIIQTNGDHGLNNGDSIEIYGVNGTATGLNNVFSVTVTGTDTFTVPFDSTALTATDGFVLNNIAGSKFNPTLPHTVELVSSAIGNPTVVTSLSRHLIATSAPVVITGVTGSNPSINGLRTATNITPYTFSIPMLTTLAGAGGYMIPTSASSTNEEAPNRIYYSKLYQPEAVPIVNFIDVGPKDKEILRVIALRDSAFILKEDGIYRLSGDNPNNFVVNLTDSSAIILSADSASILNNKIYCLTTQGIASISDTGVDIISSPIENLIKSAQLNTNFGKLSFAVTSESDRAYYLWTTENRTDTSATQCFRYNAYTVTWSRWTIGKTCGLRNSGDDKIYLGSNDTNRVEKERKNLDRTDHAEREFGLQLGDGGFTNNNLTTLSSVNNIVIGDVIAQLQYVTISQFNALLRQLDLDATNPDPTYEATFEMGYAENLTNKISALVIRLQTDFPDSFMDSNGFTSFTDIWSASLDPVVQQEEWNMVIDRLNQTPDTHTKNYPHSEGTLTYEIVITAVDTIRRFITVAKQVPFIVGNVTIYKAIYGRVTWVPNPMGDPSLVKHISTGTVIFDNKSFSTGTVSYSTDLSKGYGTIPFEAEGIGIFGLAAFGEEGFGGITSSMPLRTLVPRDKARCRYITCRFEHNNSRENISVFGLSLTVQTISERGYK